MQIFSSKNQFQSKKTHTVRRLFRASEGFFPKKTRGLFETDSIQDVGDLSIHRLVAAEPHHDMTLWRTKNSIIMRFLSHVCCHPKKKHENHELWWKFKVSLFRIHLIHLCNHKKHTISTRKFSTRITSAGTPLKPAKSLRCSWQHSDTPIRSRGNRRRKRDPNVDSFGLTSQVNVSHRTSCCGQTPKHCCTWQG